MQKSHLHLIRYTLAQGNTISVFDGEEWAVKRSTSYKDIKDAIDSVEESQLRIRDNKGNYLGWALIIDGVGFEPDETVSDHSVNEYFDKWNAAYDATVS